MPSQNKWIGRAVDGKAIDCTAFYGSDGTLQSGFSLCLPHGADRTVHIAPASTAAATDCLRGYTMTPQGDRGYDLMARQKIVEAAGYGSDVLLPNCEWRLAAVLTVGVTCMHVS